MAFWYILIGIISKLVDCTDGLFGDMCQNKCGQCSNLSQCHHIDGTCLGGCQPGYISEFCNQCKFTIQLYVKWLFISHNYTVFRKINCQCLGYIFHQNDSMIIGKENH